MIAPTNNAAIVNLGDSCFMVVMSGGLRVMPLLSITAAACEKITSLYEMYPCYFIHSRENINVKCNIWDP